MNGDPNGKRFDWRPLLSSGILVLGGWAVQWGIISATLNDHSRRLDLIEKRADERTVAREEYERRHEDLLKQVQELRQQIREIERKTR